MLASHASQSAGSFDWLRTGHEGAPVQVEVSHMRAKVRIVTSGPGPSHYPAYESQTPPSTGPPVPLSKNDLKLYKSITLDIIIGFSSGFHVIIENCEYYNFYIT